MTTRERMQKEDLPSAASRTASTPEDATPGLSENEPAHNSSRNLNNGSATTNPQTKHTQTARKPARGSAGYGCSVCSVRATHRPRNRGYRNRAGERQWPG